MTTVATMIPHSRPAIGQADLQVAAEVLGSGQIAQGPRVEQFERGMATFVGVQGGWRSVQGLRRWSWRCGRLGLGWAMK